MCVCRMDRPCSISHRVRVSGWHECSLCVGMRCADAGMCAMCGWRGRGCALVCVCVLWCQVLKVLEGHTEAVNSVAVNADGSTIVSGSSDKTVRIWSAESGQVPHRSARSAPCLPWLCVSLLTDSPLARSLSVACILCLCVCLLVLVYVFVSNESTVLS